MAPRTLEPLYEQPTLLQKSNRRPLGGNLMTMPALPQRREHDTRYRRPEMNNPPRLYVGSYNRPYDVGITIFELDEDGIFRKRGGLVARNPVNLVADRSGRFIYCGNEQHDNPPIEIGKITAYLVGNLKNGEEKLAMVNWLDAQGYSPAYVILDESGRFVLSVNHDSGKVVVMALDEKGRLDRITHVTEAPAIDPYAARGHMLSFHPTQKEVVAVSYVALDRIYFYKFDSEEGSLSPINIDRASMGDSKHLHIQMKQMTEPRHFVFSSDGQFLYILGEASSTVTVFAFTYDPNDAKETSITFLQTLSTVPPDYDDGNSGSEIALHPSGKFLYTSNRGHNSIAVFEVNQTNGQINSLDFFATGGSTPRHFILLPDGRQMIVGNRFSNSVVVFNVNPLTGSLTRRYKIPEFIQQPSFLLYTESSP